MKKRVVWLSCFLAILLWITGDLIWNWRQNNVQCQKPLLLNVPSQMPRTISGISARIGSFRDQHRNMPSWWEFNPGFPQPDQNDPHPISEIAVENNHLWTISNTPAVIQRYNLVTGEYQTYQRIDGKKIEWVDHILVTRDGGVWIIAMLNSVSELARFDREADAFKTTVEGILLFSNWKDSHLPNAGSNLAETTDGFLLIPFQENIYLYNPQQKVIQPLLQDDFGFSIQSLAVSGNSLWFTVDETREVWKLDLTTKGTTNYGPAPKEFDGAIAVDSLGRVWLGYFARLEMKENGDYQWWYPEIYPAEFIYLANPGEDSLSRYGELEYRWSDVASIFIASDDSIWFLATSGIVKYDSHQDTWCLSAPANADSIAEDKDGNLWMVPVHPTSQGLYKYKLQP